MMGPEEEAEEVTMEDVGTALDVLEAAEDQGLIEVVEDEGDDA